MLNYHPPKDLLKDQVILVTGAGDGIGRVASKTFALYGAHIILLGRTVSKLESIYDDIVAAGCAEPAIVPMDLRGAREVHYEGLADTIYSQFGQLNGLLHNAAIVGELSPIEHISKKTFEDVMHVNVTAQFQLTKALLPLLKNSSKAKILFTSSTVGKVGRAHFGAYSASKFATEGFMQVLADELSHTSIQVHAVNPGATRTPMRQGAFPAEDPMSLKPPGELMPLYLYLMSQESQHLHGKSLDAKFYLEPVPA